MTEQTFIDLGFEKQVIPPDEVEGAYEYQTYEESELACLKKLIEIVETKQQEQ
jgi:hypothetical protein